VFAEQPATQQYIWAADDYYKRKTTVNPSYNFQ